MYTAYFLRNLLLDKSKKFSINMSKRIFTIPIRLGKDTIEADVIESRDDREAYFFLAIPTIGGAKVYKLKLDSTGDVYFNFIKPYPRELANFEQHISYAIFDYYYFQGLTG